MFLNKSGWIKLNWVKFCCFIVFKYRMEKITLEYWWGMCQMTTSLCCWKAVRYRHTILPTRTAIFCLMRSWTARFGRMSISCTSLNDFLGRLVSREDSWTRFSTAYCWVQWIDLFSCCWLWILACTMRSILSPTNLHFDKHIASKHCLKINFKIFEFNIEQHWQLTTIPINRCKWHYNVFQTLRDLKPCNLKVENYARKVILSFV